ncbi:MAG: tetratricopeptide repeat protein [Bacteroidales bacterium]|nr:tetratricopeptide repeat protein [Bacteroidales bacterium]
MMIRKLILVFLLLISYMSEAQSQSSILDSLKVEYQNATDDSTRVKHLLDLSSRYVKINLDSCLNYADLALNNIHTLDSIHWYSSYENVQGQINMYLDHNDKALEHHFKARYFLDDKLKNNASDYLMAQLMDTYNSIVVLYFNIIKYPDALPYALKAKEIIEDLKNRNSEHYKPKTHISILNNIGGIYSETMQLDLAEEIYFKALELNYVLNDKTIFGVLYNNIGIINIEKQLYEKAYSYYQKSYDIRKATNDTLGYIQICNNIGKYYVMTEDHKNAIKYLNISLDLGQKHNMLKSAIFASQMLTGIYEKDKKFELAYENHKLFKQLSDSLLNKEKVRNIMRTELQYEFDLKEKELELIQQKELAAKEKRVLRSRMVAGLSILSVIIISLMAILQWNKIKHSRLRHDHLELESKHLKLEKDNLEIELDHKNKELATNVLYMVKKNEFITKIAEKLLRLKSGFKKENQQLVQEIVRELQLNAENTVWEEFEVRFQQVHHEFYEKLNNLYPDLSPNERKLCAFLRLNMTTKDISAITFQTPNSITVARSRLRKKLNIDRDENLVGYLSQF